MNEDKLCQRELAIVLPSLDPDKKFAGVVDGLLGAEFRHIVIVDDGSNEEHKRFFRQAAEHPQCHILVHEVNLGKGAALKDAFASGAEAALYIAEEYGCSAAILKARSPSCGCGRIYDGTFTRTLVDGDGLFAALLRKKGFQLFTEETFSPEQA